MRKYLLKILLWLYRESVKDFTKLTVGEEFSMYRFGTPSDVTKLIKYLQTAQMLWYYEAKTEQERNIVKGSSMILKIMLDSHNQVMEILEKEPIEAKQLALWDRYRTKNRVT
jgi:hypothetical protein